MRKTYKNYEFLPKKFTHYIFHFSFKFIALPAQSLPNIALSVPKTARHTRRR
jgi:hypothetical protein